MKQKPWSWIKNNPWWKNTVGDLIDTIPENATVNVADTQTIVSEEGSEPNE